MATMRRIGQVMLALVDQHQAMYFSLEMVLTSVGLAGNSQPTVTKSSTDKAYDAGVQLHKKLYGYAV